MEGEDRKGNLNDSRGRGVTLGPDPIQEYDFFVTPDGGETPEAIPADPREKKKKKSGRNKSTTFFLSD